MDNTIVVSTYGAIGTELNALNKTSWIATAYLLTTTAFQPLFGKLSDIFGRKSSLLFSYTVFGLGCLCCGLSRTMPQLIAARALAGIGGGGMTTVVSILVSDIVPLRTRGTWQGALNIIFSSGAAAGAPLGGVLSDTIGWRWAFLLQFPLMVIALVSVTLNLNLPPPPSTPATPATDFRSRIRRVDFFGASTLVTSVLLLLLGLDHAGNISLRDAAAYLPLIFSGVLFISFAYIERSVAAEPFAPPHVVKERSILAACMANFFSFGSYMSLLFYVPLYYQVVSGLTASEAGVRLLPAIVGSLAGSLTAGIAMQRTGGYYWITVSGYTIGALGTLMIPLFANIPGLTSLGVFTAGIGLGASVTSSLIAIIATAGTTDQAVATAVSYLFRNLGTVVGVSVASMLVQETLRRELGRRLVGDDVESIVRGVRGSLDYIVELPEETRTIVVTCYEMAIKQAFWLSVGMAAAAALSSLPMREKRLAR